MNSISKDFQDFQDFLEKGLIQIRNKYLDKVLKSFSFFIYPNSSSIITDFSKIHWKTDQIIYIFEYCQNNNNYSFQSDFFIICFENTLIFIEQTKINILYQFFSLNKEIPIYIYSERIPIILTIFEEEMNLQLKIEDAKSNQFFDEEIYSFSQNFQLKKNKQTINSIKIIENLYKIISDTISGYLIKKSYHQSQIFDRVSNSKEYLKKINEKKINEEDFIVLRKLANECVNDLNLIYHIEYGKLFVLKIYIEEKGEVLFEREKNNYEEIRYPLFPQYYGTTKYCSYDCIVIEYIHGTLLKDIHENYINDNMKIKMIFQIMISIQYLQYFGYVYRDLKPNNIIYNEQGSIVLIDFDRMIKNTQNYQFTMDFQHEYIAPEITSGGPCSIKTDIYSIGKIIEFIFSDKYIKDHSEIKYIIDKCVMNEEAARPNIYQLIDYFYKYFFSKINMDDSDIILNTPGIHNKQFEYFWFFTSENNNNYACYNLSIFYEKIFKKYQKSIQYLKLSSEQNNIDAQINLGKIYIKGEYIARDINKSIYYFSLAANQNNTDAQFNLGVIYYENKYIPRDINKSIHYLSLSANNNNSNAQLYLGIILFKGEYVPRDINKSFHYLILASNQNDLDAQNVLGLIYYSGEHISRDINKSIQYFTLAANQNNSYAQFYLGLIYYESKYIPCDINKSIYYFSLASNQNNSDAQFYLGLIYYIGEHIPRDINKTIRYFTLAANQNNSHAQFYLGLIYYDSKYIPCDIDKSIYYFSLASNQNNSYAQFYLGLIYYDSKYIPRDINKSIYYFSLASNQNNSDAQFFLGLIYYDSKYIPRDIDKSIRYFTLAANQNNSKAQFYLGLIYYDRKYIPCDIDKSIYYFSLASNQNNSDAHFCLGLIYYTGEHIPRDINKSIRYFTLSTNQNNSNAQFIFGLIYYEGNHIPRDINKSIYYFSLASNQNYSKAQYYLGLIYYIGEYISRDINKSIHYFTLAANQNNSYAQFYLGLIYYESKYIPRDINKSIYYFSLASNQNNSDAQFYLGLIYYIGEHIPRDINKSIHYFKLSSSNKNPNALLIYAIILFEGKYETKNIKKSIYFLELSAKVINEANYFLGCLYCQYSEIKRDIDKAIKYYKEGSSFNDQYSKNNLGILYKNFKRNEIAIEYFEESIRQKGDKISMYNLGHIYFYGNFVKRNIDKSIELFIKSSNKNFLPSKILLSLILVNKISPINIETISTETAKYGNNNQELNQEIMIIIFETDIEDIYKYQQIYSYYENVEFMYDFYMNGISFSSIMKTNQENKNLKTRKNITETFYEGFATDL